jgi:hypothetical protein
MGLYHVSQIFRNVKKRTRVFLGVFPIFGKNDNDGHNANYRNHRQR